MIVGGGGTEGGGDRDTEVEDGTGRGERWGRVEGGGRNLMICLLLLLSLMSQFAASYKWKSELTVNTAAAAVYQVAQEMTRMPHFWESLVHFLSLLLHHQAAAAMGGKAFACMASHPQNANKG